MKTEIFQIELVRNRLNRWKDYHEHNSNSTPGRACSDADIVADAIYHQRKPSKSIYIPDPKLDLSISDSRIKSLLEEISKKDVLII